MNNNILLIFLINKITLNPVLPNNGKIASLHLNKIYCLAIQKFVVGYNADGFVVVRYSPTREEFFQPVGNPMYQCIVSKDALEHTKAVF